MILTQQEKQLILYQVDRWRGTDAFVDNQFDYGLQLTYEEYTQAMRLLLKKLELWRMSK